MLPEFRNEPSGDFHTSERRVAMQRALRDVANMLGTACPLIIGGEAIMTNDTIASHNPADPRKVVGYASKAGPDLADQAIAAAVQAWHTWRYVPVAARVRLLLRTAAIMRRCRAELAAWMIHETSQTWADADNNVAEAIDYCEYYARSALHYQASFQPLTSFAGEQNQLHYVSMGAGIVLPPWNSPLATLVSSTVAPIVTGNTVVLLPDPRAPIIAARFLEILEDAGLPPGVVNFLPCDADLCTALVEHPQTRFIVFTGPTDVGISIARCAAVQQSGQHHLKRAILEMEGKNAIIVDETAHLHAAIEGIVTSVFGFQGQKRSACSRLIIVETVYEPLLNLIADRVSRIKLGNPAEPETHMGAVIDRNAFDTISNYIAIGQNEGRLLAGGEVVDHSLLADGGFFINPTIFADVAPDARIAQEQICGPVLACIPARTFDHAIEIANATMQRLTGSVYAQDMQRLERARDAFDVGHLYLNRPCTDARVGVQPVTSFNMSGSNSRPGGPDYLLNFLQGQVISERL